MKVDRYDDFINCNKCDQSVHTRCVKLLLEIFNKLCQNTSQKWHCDGCQQYDATVDDTIEFLPKENLHQQCGFAENQKRNCS